MLNMIGGVHWHNDKNLSSSTKEEELAFYLELSIASLHTHNSDTFNEGDV